LSFLLYVFVVLCSGPVIRDLIEAYWEVALAIVVIAAVEWTFSKTVINNLACRGLTVTNPVLFAAIFLPSCFLFYLVGALYIFVRLALLTTFGFLSLFQFEHTIFSADWCSWDISYRGLQTTVQLLNNIQNPHLTACSSQWIASVRNIQNMPPEEKAQYIRKEQWRNRISLWCLLTKRPELRKYRGHNIEKSHDHHHEENPNATFWCSERPARCPDGCWPTQWRDQYEDTEGAAEQSNETSAAPPHQPSRRRPHNHTTTTGDISVKMHGDDSTALTIRH